MVPMRETLLKKATANNKEIQQAPRCALPQNYVEKRGEDLIVNMTNHLVWQHQNQGLEQFSAPINLVTNFGRKLILHQQGAFSHKPGAKMIK